ncbi:Factor arrest protein 11 [Physocladia obscura]|uniref:Factor arrest protein 11 n=1 Tax=Physocladia obscura TaxID=109957 RepID=A0AAD5SX18_9FUNG|nr:Factor arrest protein 11 [Physocladia obscura]
MSVSLPPIQRPSKAKAASFHSTSSIYSSSVIAPALAAGNANGDKNSKTETAQRIAAAKNSPNKLSPTPTAIILGWRDDGDNIPPEPADSQNTQSSIIPNPSTGKLPHRASVSGPAAVGNQTAPYDFAYADRDKFDAEIDDFFGLADSHLTLEAVDLFEAEYSSDWEADSESKKQSHIICLLESLELCSQSARINAAKQLLYIAQGVFAIQLTKSTHVERIKSNNKFLFSLDALNYYRAAFKHVSAKFEELMQQPSNTNSQNNLSQQQQQLEKQTAIENTLEESSLYLALMYLLVEVNLQDPDFARECSECDAFDAVATVASSSYSGNNNNNGYVKAKGRRIPFAIELFEIVSVLAEANRKIYPVKKLLLLLWKVLLCTVGTRETLLALKDAGRKREGLPPVPKDTFGKSIPQDLHNLQVLTTKKYPAYYVPEITSLVPSDVALLPEPLSAVARRTILGPSGIGGNGSSAGSIIQPLIAGVMPVAMEEAVNLITDKMYIGMREVQISREMIELEAVKRRGGGDGFDFGGGSGADGVNSKKLQYNFDELLERVEDLYELNPTKPEQSGNERNKMQSPSPEMAEIADLNRHKEVVTKAISGILLILLKSMKCDEILKFEYLCQLLVDNNTAILILKMLSTWFQNPMAASLAAVSAGVGGGTVPERVDSLNGAAAIATAVSASSGMGAVWLKERDEPEELNFFSWTQAKIEADENAQNISTITPTVQSGSWRNFYTTINLLRILQKLTKRKTQRVMALVQWKASAVLKRIIKVPSIPLQIYALKLLKSQIPYMGKKWRSSNMKVITSIYLHLRPNLCEEFLSGDSDTDSDEAMAQEQNLRSLIACYHHRVYPEIYPPPQPVSSQQNSSISNIETGFSNINIADEDLDALLASASNKQSLSIADNYRRSSVSSLLNSPPEFPHSDADLGKNRYASEVASRKVLDDNFINNYRVWLDEEVFGVSSNGSSSEDDEDSDDGTVFDDEISGGMGFGVIGVGGRKVVVDEFDGWLEGSVYDAEQNHNSDDGMVAPQSSPTNTGRNSV